MSEDKAPTHTAYALQRQGRRYGEWLEIGRARREVSGVIHLFLNRTPIGGFTGYAYLAPIGTQPPDPEPAPQRPSALGSPEDPDEKT
jgi:hypothetical protein